jgi:hypothetical protein
VGNGDFSVNGFAAWFWAMGAPGFADGNTGMIKRGARLTDPVPPNVVISVDLDDLDDFEVLEDLDDPDDEPLI